MLTFITVKGLNIPCTIRAGCSPRMAVLNAWQAFKAEDRAARYCTVLSYSGDGADAPPLTAADVAAGVRALRTAVRCTPGMVTFRRQMRAWRMAHCPPVFMPV